MLTPGVDIIGAMILTAFVRPVTWFVWPALQEGSDPGGNTSGPVSLSTYHFDKSAVAQHRLLDKSASRSDLLDEPPLSAH